MDEQRAKELLTAERERVEELLAAGQGTAADEQSDDNEPPDSSDSGDELAREGVADAVQESLRERLAALVRADERLAAGTFGVSVESGDPIPDARLEADPTAELTVEEAAAREASDETPV
jgi:DnaK suppressor protein